MRVAEMQVNKANNIMEHEREIMSRPKKTWFQVGVEAFGSPFSVNTLLQYLTRMLCELSTE